jgi:drug/metabolite transporter (DMT)-like permease
MTGHWLLWLGVRLLAAVVGALVFTLVLIYSSAVGLLILKPPPDPMRHRDPGDIDRWEHRQ